MKSKIYSMTLASFLTLSIVILSIGFIVIAYNPLMSKCIIDIGILLLYLTPITATLLISIYNIIKGSYTEGLLGIILLLIIMVNILFIGPPFICG